MRNLSLVASKSISCLFLCLCCGCASKPKVVAEETVGIARGPYEDMLPLMEILSVAGANPSTLGGLSWGLEVPASKKDLALHLVRTMKKINMSHVIVVGDGPQPRMK